MPFLGGEPCAWAAPDRGEEAAGPADVPCPRGEAPLPLALDIETTGLEKDCAVTCVCVWDGGSGRTWFFRTPDEAAASGADIMRALDDTKYIYAYNGASFDLPVLVRCCFCGDIEILGRWMLKLVDPLYAARAVWGFGQPLSEFLALNHMPSKTGSGAHAVELAAQGLWEDLGDYCMTDTRLTFNAIHPSSSGALWHESGARYNPWSADTIFTHG
jgi:RNase_H superfamily